ncbi:MAG: hypothetical protein WA003_05585 [Desulfuromonadaceae bacterium]
MELTKTKEIDRFAYVKGLLKMYRIPNRTIAIKLGITDSGVGHVLSGRKKSRRVQQAVADSLNMTFDDVWGKAA